MAKKKRSFIRKMPGFRSGKKWKMIIASIVYLFIFLIVLAGIFGGSSNSEETETQTLVIKSPEEILPERNDLSTEWVFGDVKNITINNSGFESGFKREIRIGSVYSRNIVTVSIYKFSSVNGSKAYYENKIIEDSYLQKGGYKEVNLGSKCKAYKVDKTLTEFGRAYCTNSNIFFKLNIVSETYESEEYLKNLSRVIFQKIG